MKKRILAMLMASAMAVSMAACSSNTQQGTEPADQAESTGNAGDVSISVILKAQNSEYWNAVTAGAEQAAAGLGCKVSVQGPSRESAYDEQINTIETVLNSNEYDAMVLAPLQPDSAKTAVSNASIPVLAVDTTFPADNLVSYIGVSNEDAAKAGGEYIAEQLGGSGNVVILAGVQADTTSEDRIKGWTEGLEAGGCTVLDMQYTNAVADQAVSAMEGLMQQYPDQIDAVVCHSDDVAMGAANAVQGTDILVCGFGGISGAEPVKDGTLTATVDIGPYEMGYNCVARALDAAQGKEIDSFYPTEPQIIDASNVDAFLEELASWSN